MQSCGITMQTLLSRSHHFHFHLQMLEPPRTDLSIAIAPVLGVRRSRSALPSPSARGEAHGAHGPSSSTASASEGKQCGPVRLIFIDRDWGLACLLLQPTPSQQQPPLTVDDSRDSVHLQSIHDPTHDPTRTLPRATHQCAPPFLSRPRRTQRETPTCHSWLPPQPSTIRVATAPHPP